MEETKCVNAHRPIILLYRIEKEIEALETQELNISANEEVVLKRLKEVERTAEDIIKVRFIHLQFVFCGMALFWGLPALPRVYVESMRQGEHTSLPFHVHVWKALTTFAMEISVEHDKRTGKSQVVSTATITPETMQERGLKVYDDGRKSVYALHPDGGKMHNGAVGEMSSTEVEELLHQATDKSVPTEVQYHQPVYSLPYTASSTPSTPRTPNKTTRQTPTPSPRAQILREESQCSQDLERWKTPSKTPSPSFIQQDSESRVQRRMPAPIQPSYRVVDSRSPSQASHKYDVDPDALIESSGDFNRQSPFCAESIASLNLVNTLPEELESDPVTMIFMGYKNAEAEDEEDIQAELVIIGNSDNDDDEAQFGENESGEEECLSYHPEGYSSKVFQPKVGIAKVTGCRDIIEDTYTNWEDLGFHKPTFTHKSGKPSPYTQGQRVDESANTGSINMEKMKLCSTGR
uniref:Palmdelphin n=1 Tax=Sander lucioperca TaxID=283035 RepID=A0A8D0D379_SANLU